MLDEAKKEMAEEEEEFENMTELRAKKEKDTEVCHSNMLKNQEVAVKLAAIIMSKLKEAATTAKQTGHLDEAKNMVVEADQMLAKLEALAKKCENDTKVWREKWGSGSEGPKTSEKLDKEIKAANERCLELLTREKRDVKTVYEFFAKMKGSGTV